MPSKPPQIPIERTVIASGAKQSRLESSDCHAPNVFGTFEDFASHTFIPPYQGGMKGAVDYRQRNPLKYSIPATPFKFVIM
jgi:hypothetical protein